MEGPSPAHPHPSRTLFDHLRPHLAGIAVVLVLAAALAAPRWWFLATDPTEGVRVQVNPGGLYGIGWDEALYVPIIRESFDGDLLTRDPYLYEHQDDPPLSFAWWPALIGQVGRLIGDMFLAFALVHTLAVTLGLLFLYALAYRISRSRVAATAAAPIAMVAAQVLYQSHGFWALRHGDVLDPLVTIDPPGEFHSWFRFLAPSMALAATFGAILALHAAVETRRRTWQFATVLFIALAVYTNPFLWTALVLAIGIWSATLTVDRHWRALRDVALITGLALLLALPELAIVALNVVETPRDAAERAGLLDRGIETEFLGILAQRGLFVVVLTLLARPWTRATRLWVALAVAPLLLASTAGLVPQVDHYLYQVWVPFTIPLAIAAATSISKQLAERWQRVAAIAIGAVTAAATLYVVAFQVRAIGELDQAYAVRPDEAAAIDWIDDNLDESAVVVTPSRSTNILLAALTPVYLYVPGGAGSVGTRASDQEIIDRYLRASAAFGHSTDDTLYRLEPENGIPRPEREDIAPDDIERYVERSMVDYLLNERVDRPAEVRARLPGWRDEYERLLEEPGVLRPYRATYLYCGPRERLWLGAETPSSRFFVEPVFASGEVWVLRLAQEGDPGAELFRGCAAAAAVKVQDP